MAEEEGEEVDEVERWLSEPDVCLGTPKEGGDGKKSKNNLREKLAKLGIRTVADFAELDELDIDGLFDNKYDKNRFMKALARSMPSFLRQAAEREQAPSPLTPKDKLKNWLEKASLEDYFDKMWKAGIRRVSDLVEIEEDDMKAIGLSKFDKIRFCKSQQALRKLMGWSAVDYDAYFSGAPQMQVKGALPKDGGNAYDPMSVPQSIVMAKGSVMALEQCRSPLEGSGAGNSATLDNMYSNWKTVRHARNQY